MPQIIGVIIKTWAITMARTVKRSPRDPRGPRRIRRRYTTRPATTGGVPIRVRHNLTTIRFPGKLFFSRSKPRTVPRTDAIKVDARDILKVTLMIPRISEFRIIILLEL
jgi:hypothetical protein